jgi:hypothetical protein
MPNTDGATLAALAALNGGAAGNLSAGTTGADLANFQRTVSANDPWNMAYGPVATTKLDTSTWTPNQALAGNLGQAALAAILKTLGNRDEANQLYSVAQVLPQLYKDPTSVANPEGVDPAAFNALKFSAIGREATTNDLIRRQLGQLGITQNEDGSIDTSVADALNTSKVIGKSKDAAKLTPQAVQKLSTAQGLLGQLEQAKGLVDKFSPNPDLGIVGQIPGVGSLASEVLGAGERRVAGLKNNTPEGQYGSLMQSVYEGVGKFISNTARQKVIDENKALTDAGRLGDNAGTKQALQNIQDIIRQDILDQASGYSEQNYRQVQDAVSAANTIGVDAPMTPNFEIRIAPSGQKYKVLLGK